MELNGKVLVDSQEFCSCLKQDLQSAREYVYLQTMSYEGDSAGKMVSGLLLSSGAKDKRIIVDNFTKFKLSDRFLYFPRNFFDPELRLEARETHQMFEDLRKGDVRVKFVNPFFGPLLVKFVARDHKKMIVIDDHISYLGGLNFSDHNFSW
ncbi:MAG: phospholipase D-like domain-containing protein, partial [candidate division Zixibacteria bacterium]|nr:phospholipase D-like domain-containing protein [candidate division Zixibacteria bacterium]